MNRTRLPLSLLPVMLGLAACTLSPLSRKIKVGEEPMVVFVATANNEWTDLFATRPVGGEVVQLTFTRLRESMPRLTSHGEVVAFVRTRGEEPGEDLVVMNLLNGAERLLELPPEAGRIAGLGWSSDDAWVFVRSDNGYWRVAAPPATLTVDLLGGADTATAHAATMVQLGRPAFATATVCDSGGICITGPSGVPASISAEGSAPFRWGSDSVAWIENGTIVVRSLGPGAARRIEIGPNADGIREAAYAQP
ncbi:MAG TPA: hypothetical protein PLL69_04190 [Gemmatimonadales bacterium]|nr:hypothetical protein [Gemmatimonadales bacterium]